MSTRETTLGVEFLATISPNVRETEIGAEFLASINNNVRETVIGVEYLAKVLVPAHRITGYLKDQLINHVFRTAVFAKPIHLSVGLFTDQPDPTSNPTGTEVTGGSYARVMYQPLDTNWAAPTSGSGQTSNLLAITFPVPTVSWGLIEAYGLFDEIVGGNLLAWATLTTPQTVGIGSNPRFIIGALTATFG